MGHLGHHKMMPGQKGENFGNFPLLAEMGINLVGWSQGCYYQCALKYWSTSLCSSVNFLLRENYSMATPNMGCVDPKDKAKLE